MIAADANILVRYVTNDDPLQARRALAILARKEDILIPKTVLLETEWVLRAVYELPVASILKALLHILGLPNVVAENPEEVSLALDYYGRGLDFADALHLASSCHADAFFSFDAEFVKRGKKIGARMEKG